MASGYFPLSPDDWGHADLVRAIALVESVAWNYHHAACENSTQFDNATDDGVHVGYLRAAADLIRKCLRKEA